MGGRTDGFLTLSPQETHFLAAFAQSLASLAHQRRDRHLTMVCRAEGGTPGHSAEGTGLSSPLLLAPAQKHADALVQGGPTGLVCEKSKEVGAE